MPGILQGVTDWRVFDSTTVRLHDALADKYPGAGEYAALKIHKEGSVGTGNLVSYKVTAAREHDSPHLVVDRAAARDGPAHRPRVRQASSGFSRVTSTLRRRAR